MTKKKEYTPEETIVNKAISEVIQYFFVELTGNKPDASQYKSGRNIVHDLMFPSEYRTYTEEEMKRVVDILKDSKITIMTLNILLWPSLVATLVDGDERTIRMMLDTVRNKQKNTGQYIEDQKPPKGW